MKKQGKCVHYNGTVNECCKAGVNYRQLAGPPESAYGRRLPCSPDLPGGHPEEKVTCSLRVLPTAEELAAEEAWLKERYEKIGKARAAIVEKLGGPWTKKNRVGGHGRIDCPACGVKDSLGFSRAAYNGHIHASCGTTGCVAWME